MIQTNIFDWIPNHYPKSLPYAKERPTSKAGAEHAKPSAATQCSTILMALRLAGTNGMTASELKAKCDIKQSSTMSARLNSLMKAGRIIDSGLRRKSSAGVNNIVWRII